MSATAVPAPSRGLEQRLAALREANRVRCARSVLKADLKAGRVSVVDVLVSPPEFVDTMRVFELLLAVPKVGPVKATKLLQRAGTAPSRSVGALSQRQVRELVALLGGRR